MFIWFAKKLGTSTDEGWPLEQAKAVVLGWLHPRNSLAALIFASVLSVTFSIAVSQFFLATAIVCWLSIVVRDSQWNIRPILPIYFLVVFAAIALISAVLSPLPLYSLGYFKKFWIFSLLWLVPLAFRTSQEIERLYCWIAVGSTLSAGVGIFQYFFDSKISLTHRITGLSGHWMTFAGLQMLSLVALAALLLSNRTAKYRWIYPAIPVQIFALALSQTRSAWLGLLVGFLTLVWLVRHRWVLLFLPLAAGSYLLLPEHFQDRMLASFDLADPTTRIRLELLRTGWNIIKAHPFFGIAPRMIPIEYPHYNTTNEFPSWIYQHLHNNFIQVSAELGLIALVAWICFVGAFLAHSMRHLVADGLPGTKRFAARATISCIVALLVAGMFEYNFGDSEVLTLFLFVVTSPYVVFRETNSCGGGAL
ncbi:MAG: O-antigen ligase family protein [Acidobacteria bacterium]|nr:O-antigen ligase family protein [Acidobacteriota bacterium]